MEKMRVLVVDDETIQAMDTAGMVRELGHEVIGMAYTYDQAVEMTRRFCPDIVLMDINLGELDCSGIDAVASLQETCAFRVIYISAYADERTIKKAVATEPLGYLVKPFRQSELMALLLLARQQMQSSDAAEAKMYQLAFDCGYFKNEAAIQCADRTVPLTKNEQKLVELLIDAGGSVVSFDTIEYEIWPDKSTSSGAKRTLVYRINQKVGEKLIQNIQGIGCRILLK